MPVEVAHEALGRLLVGVELGLVKALHDDTRAWLGLGLGLG